MSESVLGFFGPYRYLSNFHLAWFMWNGIRWISSEHAYQAAKLKNPEKMKTFAKLSSPKDAKIAGGLIPCREDWDDVKYTIMYEVVKAKFSQNKDIADLLIGTGDAYLEETNTWYDTTWGVCDGKGLNWLGKILMQVRDEIKHADMIDDILGFTDEEKEHE